MFEAEIAERVYLPGDIILREGEPATAMYVILDGDVQVLTETPDGETLILNRQRTGEHFGEQALLSGRENIRTATVRAFSRTRLAEIPARLVTPHLRAHRALERRLIDRTDERLQRQLLLQSAVFRGFRLDLEAHGEERLFEPGDVLFRQGEVCDHLYLLLEGEVEVYDTSSGERVTLNRVRAGRCVGELGLVDRAPRSASVEAVTRVRALRVSGDRFLSLYERSPELRESLAELRRYYTLPQGGSLAQYQGRLLNQPAITSVYEVSGGRSLIVSRLEDGSFYNLERARPAWDAATVRRLERRGADGGLDFELRVIEGDNGDAEIVGLSTWTDGPWNEALHRLALDDVRLTPAEQRALVEQGTLPAAEALTNEEALLCRCVQVSYAEVESAIAAGCRELASLQERTGCGTVCGGCRGRVLDILDGGTWIRARIDAVRAENEHVSSFRLTPTDCAAAPFTPGQHLEVRGQIHGHPVIRPYTISSSAIAPESYEITVRREPKGVFSGWLFERAVGDEVEISAPRGDVPALDPERPLVCLVAGIGVTPALSISRTLRDAPASGRALIHYSVSERADAIGLDALGSTPGVELRLHETAQAGRLGRAEIRSIAARHPDATYLLCGPAGYLDDVSAHLAAAGVPDARLHVERFISIGAPPAPPPAPPPLPSRSLLTRLLGQVGGALRGLLKLVLLFAPLLYVASAALLPLCVLAGWLDRVGAMIWAGLIAAAFVYDLLEARLEWREFFFVELPDDEVIGASALRPPLFRQNASARSVGRLSDETPTRMLMRRLSFRSWLHYKYTLRFDYILNDVWRALRHLARRALMRAGFERARRWEPLYAPFWEDPSLQLAELILETTLIMGVTNCRTDPETGRRVGTFVYSDWHCPAGIGFERERLVVERFEVDVDLEARRALGARLNGAEIDAGRDALTLAFMAVSFYYHTVMHAYANWACVPDHPDALLANAATYTMAMNGQAWYSGLVCQQDPHNMRLALTYNASRGFHRHGTGALHREVVRHSRSATFYMKARPIVMEVLTEHEVEIDPEAFFLMSVLHSVDHHYIAACSDPTDLSSPLLGDYRGGEWTRVLFVQPLAPIFADTRLSRSTPPWARALYRRLREIDPEHAARVDYCIRY